MEFGRITYKTKITNWYKSIKSRMLFIVGMPGVGKTTLILNWCKENEINYNYFRRDDYKYLMDVFNGNKLIDYDIKLKNTLFGKESLSSLLIFDDIEPSDTILFEIKSICERSKFKFIVISDYGECVFENINFQPIGYFEVLRINTLSFKEFCLSKINIFTIKQIEKEINDLAPNALSNFSNFQFLWELYKKFGGFPKVVEKLFLEGEKSATEELEKIKYNIVNFIKQNFNDSASLLRIIDNYSVPRSSIYKRYVFKNISIYSTLKRSKKALARLEDFGLINVLPIKCKNQLFEYCDIFLMDLGLENIWNDKKLDSNHILCSSINIFLNCNDFHPYRYASKDKIEMDFIYGFSHGIFIDVKSKLTYGKASIDNRGLKIINELNFDSFDSFILIDSFKKIEKGNRSIFMPIWAYLLK